MKSILKFFGYVHVGELRDLRERTTLQLIGLRAEAAQARVNAKLLEVQNEDLKQRIRQQQMALRGTPKD